MKPARFSVLLGQQVDLGDGGVRFLSVSHCWLGSGCACIHFVHLTAARDAWGACAGGCSCKEAALQATGLGSSGRCRCSLLLSRLPEAFLGGLGAGGG